MKEIFGIEGIEVIEDLEYEFDIINKHFNLWSEREHIGNLIFTRVTDFDDTILTCGLKASSEAHYTLYRFHKHVGTNLRINACDVYDNIDIELYKSNEDYRFQIDSAYTLLDLEWHVSRVLYHRIFDGTIYEFGSMYLNSGSRNNVIGRKMRLKYYKENGVCDGK